MEKDENKTNAKIVDKSSSKDAPVDPNTIPATEAEAQAAITSLREKGYYDPTNKVIETYKKTA